MVRFLLIPLLAAGLFTSCEAGDDFPETIVSQTPPILKKVDPQSLHRGETLTLYGNGFSIAPAENTVILGNRSVNGSSYGLNDGTVEGAAEKLTVTIPNDLPDGEQGVTLSVLGNNTNSDLKITILP